MSHGVQTNGHISGRSIRRVPARKGSCPSQRTGKQSNTDTNRIVRGATSCQNTDQPRDEERLHIRLGHFVNPTFGKRDYLAQSLGNNTLQTHLRHFVDVEKDQVILILLSIIPDTTFETSSLVDDGRPVTMG
jgi:hypothetical protein